MKFSKSIWCALLLIPAAMYYALILWLPENINAYLLFGLPPTIAYGLVVMLWAVIVGLVYAYTSGSFTDE